MGEEMEKIDKREPKAADVPKKPRSRKKLQHQNLRKQMEFYFSDANLSKDRFMNQLLQESQYVDLNSFLVFNRIKNITTSIKDIAKALQSSDLLKVTDCGTKVYRVKPLELKSNSEECTIYVENIPATADHDFLTDVFSSYGDIDYVSIPRFKHSRANKGFAFIEFKQPESVNNAIRAFKGFGCHLLDKIEPAQLCSIKTFNEEREIEKTYHDGVNKCDGNSDERSDLDREEEDCLVGNSTAESLSRKNDDGDDKNSLLEERDRESNTYKNDSPDKSCLGENLDGRLHGNKRKNVEIETESTDEPEVKKLKKNVDNISVTDAGEKKKRTSSEWDQETDETEKKKGLKIRSEDELEAKKMKKKQCDDNLEVFERKSSISSDKETSETDSKKKRKRLLSSGESDVKQEKVRKQSGETCGDDLSCGEKNESPGDEMPVKEELDTDRNELPPQESSNNDDGDEFEDGERKKKHRKRKKKAKKEKACLGLQILTKKEWKVMRNKYLTEQRKRMSELKKHLFQKRWEHYKSRANQESDKPQIEEEEVSSNNKERFSDLRVNFIPGVIVRAILDEPIVNKDSFKTELKRNPEIKYIDVKDGLNIVHLRFSSAEAAKQFEQNSPWQGAKVLEGSEEQDYWDKLWKDREQKINKNNRKPKNGRKKLLEKAEDLRSKHIRFD